MKEFVEFNGRRVSKDWPERVAEAQKDRFYNDLADTPLPRIPYSQETRADFGNQEPCHDCAVMPGQLHVPGCDVEECPSCNGQVISCGCGEDDEGFDTVSLDELDLPPTVH